DSRSDTRRLVEGVSARLGVDEVETQDDDERTTVRGIGVVHEVLHQRCIVSCPSVGGKLERALLALVAHQSSVSRRRRMASVTSLTAVRVASEKSFVAFSSGGRRRRSRRCHSYIASRPPRCTCNRTSSRSSQSALALFSSSVLTSSVAWVRAGCVMASLLSLSRMTSADLVPDRTGRSSPHRSGNRTAGLRQTCAAAHDLRVGSAR